MPDDDEDEFEDFEPWDDEQAELLKSRRMFRDPGGRSALRAESAQNPRNLPCPTCGEPDRLTPADRSLGYQCDRCADRDEMGF